MNTPDPITILEAVFPEATHVGPQFQGYLEINFPGGAFAWLSDNYGGEAPYCLHDRDWMGYYYTDGGDEGFRLNDADITFYSLVALLREHRLPMTVASGW